MNQKDRQQTMAETRRRQQARQRNSRMHQKKRRKNYILHYVLGFILTVATGLTLSLTVFFNVQQVEITGSTRSQEEILQIAGVTVGDNLFRINLEAIEEALMQEITTVDGVTVNRKLPSTLEIVFEPATTMAIFYAENNFYFVSENGRITQKKQTLEEGDTGTLLGGIPITDPVGGFITESETMQLPLFVLQQLQDVGLTDVTQMSINETNEITLSYQNRVTVQLGTQLDLDYKLQIVKKVLDEHVSMEEQGIIDARTPSVAYFRPMDMATQQQEGIAVDVIAEFGPAPEAATVDPETGEPIVPEEDGATSQEGSDPQTDETQDEAA